MIADLKPYPVMKDSGVPWLGEVPEHWGLPRLGAILRERCETNDDNNVVDVLSVMRERGVIPYAEKGNVGNKKSDDITRYKIVRPNDIVVNCMNVIIGSVGLSKYTGCLSPVYYVLTRRSEIDDPRYLNAYFQTKPFQLSLVRIGNGILAHRMWIPMELLKCEPFPRPPATEQTAIVRFLDYIDRRIRKYIRAKQKLIKLLEEQKQAIIHCAVTRGLDPNVRLKPSGVEWLGEVPERWEVVRLKNLVSRVTSGSRGWSNFAADDGVLFIRIGNLTRASIGLDLDNTVHLRLPRSVLGEADRTRVQRNDILLSITAFIGSVAVVPADIEEAYISQHVACCRPRVGKSNSRWVAYVLLSSVGQTHGQLSMYGGTKQGLSLDDVKNYLILLPPIDEQSMLVEWIERTCSSVDTATQSARCEISLLREYRTRLIADVVTGKLDVREAAARLPDEADELGLVDEGDAMSAVDEEPFDDLDIVPEEVEA
jgi:type I restriction enzyme S subunit